MAGMALTINPTVPFRTLDPLTGPGRPAVVVGEHFTFRLTWCFGAA